MLSSRAGFVATAGGISVFITLALMLMTVIQPTSLEHSSPFHGHNGSAFTGPHRQVPIQPLTDIDESSDDQLWTVQSRMLGVSLSYFRKTAYTDVSLVLEDLCYLDAA
jgi:hypothetical protein